LLIDSERQLAFIACEDNATLLVPDLRTRKIAASFHRQRIRTFWHLDPGLGLLCRSESGTTTLFGFEAGKVKVGEAFSGPGVRRSWRSTPRRHDVYLPLMNLEGASALRIARPGPIGVTRR
jgi:hypothetical protein